MSRALRGDVAGVQLFVRDPRGAADFLSQVLGFLVRVSSGDPTEGEESWRAENGALRLRLSPVSQSTATPGVTPVWLEVETESVAESLSILARRGDVRRFGDLVERSDGLEQRFHTDHGFGLVLCQELTEDDLCEPPPLPSSMDWCPEADRLVRAVLRRVPLTFRDAARRRATERAETLALAAGIPRVEEDRAVQALFDATPDFQHESLDEALADARRAGAD